MERLHVSIPFFLWFPTFTSKFGLPEIYSQPSLNVQTSLMKVWHFVKGSSVSAIHPPLDNLTFLLEDVALNATPFRKGRGEIPLLLVLMYKKSISNSTIQIQLFLP